MMIAKKTGPWGKSAHEHHDSKRRHAKLEGWPSPRAHPQLVGEEPDVRAVSHEYAEALEKLFARAIDRCPSISMDKDIMQGQPCIFGTRIPVRSVLRVLEHTASADSVKESYPHLTTQQVEDVLYFSQLILELPSGVDETATIA